MERVQHSAPDMIKVIGKVKAVDMVSFIKSHMWHCTLSVLMSVEDKLGC